MVNLKKMVLLVVMALLISAKAKAGSDNVTYHVVQRVDDETIFVRATDDYYFDRIKQSQTKWTAECIEKGTLIGETHYSFITSQTDRCTVVGSHYAGVDYGKTWGDAVNYAVGMQPKKSVRIREYVASDYSMSNAKLWAMGDDSYYPVASEELRVHTVLSAPSKSFGYLCSWSPKYSGKDYSSYSMGLSLNIGVLGFSVGKEIGTKNKFVEISDDCNIKSGRFDVTYDYIKYNGIGLCSGERGDVVFKNSTVTGAYEFQAVKAKLNKNFFLYFTPCFKVCNGKTFPKGINGYTGFQSARITGF